MDNQEPEPLHPNEPHLTFRTSEGKVLPTAEMRRLLKEAQEQGPVYKEALTAQVARQLAVA